MIESIEFKNFRALRDAKLPLSQFTLIVGPNGSGKSTALAAVMALGNPNLRWDQVCTAGAPRPANVSLQAIWTEEFQGTRNNVSVLLTWPDGPTGPSRALNHQAIAARALNAYPEPGSFLWRPNESQSRCISNRSSS